MKHTYILYVDIKYNILAAPHRDITFQNTWLHDFFRAVDTYVFFLLPNAKQVQYTFAHCLFMYRDVTFLAEYDLISGFFYLNIFEILLARGCARDRLSLPCVSPFLSVLLPLSLSRPEFSLRRLRAGYNGLYRFSVSVVPLFYPFFKRGYGERRDRGWHGARPITNVKSISHCRGIGEVRRPRCC